MIPELTPEEHEEAMATAQKFEQWFNEHAATGELKMAAIPEIIGLIWTRLRQHMTLEEAHVAFHWIMEATETRLQTGNIEIQLKDGTRLPYMTAEDYEGREEMRDMLIAASHGGAFDHITPEDFNE